ncbi:hypothetical protein ABT352_32995 [Streptosporangium sp. NPDC000563]|uniref:DUF6907 domain-containing protein n=1 Tax=Streptosporangium sp. NPDC000563 TaxID=3154366 RepID=UPI003317DF89
MGWSNEDGEHEGWDAAQFPDGGLSVGSGGGGALARQFAPGPLHGQHRGEPETVDGRTAIGWRGLCECGWRGQLWERVATPGEHDPDRRRIYDIDPSPYGDAPGEVGDAIHVEWKGHLEPESLSADQPSIERPTPKRPQGTACPTWCVAGHEHDDYFRIHRSESVAIGQSSLRPSVLINVGRVDEPARIGKPVVQVGLLTSAESARLSPQEAVIMADVLDALEPDCPSPTDVLSVRLREAAALATPEDED